MALFTIAKDPVSTEPEAIASKSSDVCIVCKSPEKLKTLVARIECGTDIHYISDGDWSMHDLLASLLPKYAPADLYLTTYAIRELAVRQMVLFQESGHLKSVNMLVDYRAQIRVPAVYQLAANNATQIRLLSLHAKVMVLKGMDKSVSIVGSANWTTNPRIEAGVISTDPAVAEFHIGWINKLLENAEIFE